MVQSTTVQLSELTPPTWDGTHPSHTASLSVDATHLLSMTAQRVIGARLSSLLWHTASKEAITMSEEGHGGSLSNSINASRWSVSCLLKDADNCSDLSSMSVQPVR